jgi:hypothetical protein
MIENALKASTQEHLDIYTVMDHLAVLKDGSVALVIQTTAINFNLLSEEEQDATIYAYASLLNSLSFTVQILIRSSKKDITDYLNLLDEKLEAMESQKIKEQLVKYRAFVKGLVKENNVLEKRFYIVVPFTVYELGLSANQFNPLARPPQKPAYDVDYILNKAKLVLYPRRDHIVRQLARIGLRAKQLENKELITLFYRIYNAEAKDQSLNLNFDDQTPPPSTDQVATPAAAASPTQAPTLTKA